jgi:sigma-E factor negative regulatory protein RseC
MEQLVRVKQTYDDGTALVIRVRESACSGDCHKCSGCGAQKQVVLLRAVNAINAEAGELVKVRSESGPLLAGAAVIYMLPIVLFFLGYMIGQLLWQQGALAGGVAFAIGIAGAVLYDRLVAQKQKMVYTITGYPTNDVLQMQIKGDNDLD